MRNQRLTPNKWQLQNLANNNQNNGIYTYTHTPISSVQLGSAAESYPTFCDPMNRRTPGFPVHHQLPEFTQIHVHQGGDAIQPS